MSRPEYFPRQVILLVITLICVAAHDASADLYEAAGAGNLELVRKLVTDGALVSGLDENGLTPRNHAESGGHRSVFQYLLVAEALAGEMVMRFERPPTFDHVAYVNRHVSRLLGIDESQASTDTLNVQGLLDLQEAQRVVFPTEIITERLQLEFWISDPIVTRESEVDEDCHVCISRIWRDPRVGLERVAKGGCISPDEIGGVHTVLVLNTPKLEKDSWVEIISRQGASCPGLPP